MKKTVLMASALMMGAAMPAFANDDMKDMSASERNEAIQEKFDDMDSDNNDMISRSEYDAAGKSDEDFTAADTNKNGSLSLAEVKAWKQREWNQSSNSSNNMNGTGSNARDMHGSNTGSSTDSSGTGTSERLQQNPNRTAH